MEKFEQNEVNKAEQAKEEQPKAPESFFEDHFKDFENLKDLKQYLRSIAENGGGKLELNEEGGNVSRTEIGEITRSITAVAEEEAGYTLQIIPGTKLREAVGRILEAKKNNLKKYPARPGYSYF